MVQGYRSIKIQKQFSWDSSTLLEELIAMVHRCVNQLEYLQSLLQQDHDKGTEMMKEKEEKKKGKASSTDSDKCPNMRFELFTPLKVCLSTILVAIEGIRMVHKLKRKDDEIVGNYPNSYCEFNRAPGHSMNKCKNLQNENERLIHEGKLNKFKAMDEQDRREYRPRRGEERQGRREEEDDSRRRERSRLHKQPCRQHTLEIDNEPAYPPIGIISGEETSAGDSYLARKVYAH